MSQPASSESLWAEHGLTGLVLFSLFGLIILFLRMLSTTASSNQRFIQALLEEERSERKEARRETSAATNKLSKAIDGLAVEMRNRGK